MGDPWVLKVDLKVTDSIVSRSTTAHLLIQMRLPPDIEVSKEISHQALTEGLLHDLVKVFSCFITVIYVTYSFNNLDPSN